ncbi:GNAT family N-acetyltransferase [Brevundimonas sp.]|uniref:GNAT family N-acetyltransferase n=1 Tax=Brevundimonas sp. TaxID=1871086 RepID=UPI001A246DF2|nr:GNAT family N-acetyltransferase [Brevundimonas sp.]MBJ7484508.1 GNAT family N-acetyltransferase [Brevundimonas sp.]
MTLSLRPATAEDIPALHALIERGYRGESAKRGWTHEADLLGGQRTSTDELSGIITDPDQVILLAQSGGVLIGCVRVMRQGDGSAYLGMLTVDPVRQAGGMGRTLLEAAEAEARSRFGVGRMEMTVISTRSELIAWYERRGYRLTGRTAPFPADVQDFGDLPPQTLEFVVMDRAL